MGKWWGGGWYQEMAVKDKCTLNRGGHRYRLDSMSNG